MTKVVRYRPEPANWPASLGLRIVVLSDVHACWPWMTPDKIARICAEANRLKPDITFLLGDYVEGIKRWARPVPVADWAGALAGLKAPLGVHAILGNHDWWEDAEGQHTLKGPIAARRGLEAVGIPVYENDVGRIETKNGAFWLAGLAEQRPQQSADHGNTYAGPRLDDLGGTLTQVTDQAPVILMTHVPDIFPDVPARVALTLAGHTHAGQFRFFGWTRWTSSAFGNRFGYGHVREDGRDLIVSAGLGMSVIPLRIGAPPEIVVVELGAEHG